VIEEKNQMSVNIKTLKATATKYDIEIPVGSKVDAVVKLISDYFAENFDTDTLMKCDGCGNFSTEFDENGEVITECPFCAANFVGEAVEAGDPEPAPDPEVPAPVEKVKGKGGRKPKADKTEGEPKEKGKPGRKPKEDKIVPVEEKYIVTPEQLKAFEAAVAKIRHLQQTRAETTYQIGTELNRLNSENLWKGMTYASQDAEGKPAEKQFANFTDFVKVTFDISRSGAFKYMRCAGNFSEAEYQKIGVRACDLILSASEGIRDNLKDVALTGAPFVELKGIIKAREGTPTSGSAKSEGASKATLTLLSRSKQGDINIAWLDNKTREAVARGNTKEKHFRLDLTSDYELIVFYGASGLDVTASIRAIEKPGDAPATPGIKIVDETEPTAE
jgi:hypothetical protein